LFKGGGGTNHRTLLQRGEIPWFFGGKDRSCTKPLLPSFCQEGKTSHSEKGDAHELCQFLARNLKRSSFTGDAGGHTKHPCRSALNIEQEEGAVGGKELREERGKPAGYHEIRNAGQTGDLWRGSNSPAERTKKRRSPKTLESLVGSSRQDTSKEKAIYGGNSPESLRTRLGTRPRHWTGRRHSGLKPGNIW